MHLSGVCAVHHIGLTDLDNATGENEELLSGNESNAAGRSLRYFFLEQAVIFSVFGRITAWIILLSFTTVISLNFYFVIYGYQ